MRSRPLRRLALKESYVRADGLSTNKMQQLWHCWEKTFTYPGTAVASHQTRPEGFGCKSLVAMPRQFCCFAPDRAPLVTMVFSTVTTG